MWDIGSFRGVNGAIIMSQLGLVGFGDDAVNNPCSSYNIFQVNVHPVVVMDMYYFIKPIHLTSSGFVNLQRYMDSEIRAIMAQYMPLDNQGEVPNHIPHGDI